MGKKMGAKRKGEGQRSGQKTSSTRSVSGEDAMKRTEDSDNSSDDFVEQRGKMELVKLNESPNPYSARYKRAKNTTTTKEGDVDAPVSLEIEVAAPPTCTLSTHEERGGKGKQKLHTRGKLPGYQHMETRSSPCTLVEALQELKQAEGNEAQIRALHYIGFGALLELELKRQPLSLGSWLVEHFDPNKCSIEFPDGRSIEITDVDVHRCLGIPLGMKPVVLRGQNENKDILETWRLQYDKQYACLRPQHIKTALLKGIDGGL